MGRHLLVCPRSRKAILITIFPICIWCSRISPASGPRRFTSQFRSHPSVLSPPASSTWPHFECNRLLVLMSCSTLIPVHLRHPVLSNADSRHLPDVSCPLPSFPKASVPFQGNITPRSIAMARPTRVATKPSPRSKKTSSPSVNDPTSHPAPSPSPRRSSRLRSSPPRTDATHPMATSRPRAVATPKAVDAESRRPRSERRQSLIHTADEEKDEERSVPVPPHPGSGKGALARGSATHLHPNADVPRSPNKRRRGPDHYDLVPVSSTTDRLNNEMTTPRTLRALKRQRLLLHIEAPPALTPPPEPFPSGLSHDRPGSPSPSSGETQSPCPELPHTQPDSESCVVAAGATAPAEELGTQEHLDAALGENETKREQFGSGPGPSATESLLSGPAQVPVEDEATAASPDEHGAVAEVRDCEFWGVRHS